MTASEIIEKYIKFFEERGHKKIEGAPLVPQDDPTTLFTSSGMQPLIKYFLGEPHPLGKKIVDVQNCFRAQDIDEVGDNRHTTFFRMLGNWSFGDYFKKEQFPWFFEFLTKELGISPERLYVSVFEGEKELDIPRDEESAEIWKDLFRGKNIEPEGRIFYYGVSKNWWSRSGLPKDMPEGEPGGPDSEVFYDFGEELKIHKNSKYKNDECHINCDCGRYLEIGNSVFMQYQKQKDGSFKELPQKNVDFGGGLERLLAAVENKPDIFQTSLFAPVIKAIEKSSDGTYENHANYIRLIADHFTASTFIIVNGVTPSNKEQGYVLRRLLRRGIDSLINIGGPNSTPIIETIINQYKVTDPYLTDKFEFIKNTFLEEQSQYLETLEKAKAYTTKKHPKIGDELKGITEISADEAFDLYQSYGLSPTQIRSLGYNFNQEEFAQKMKEHQEKSRLGAQKKFKGGLADESELTIMGHTATHLLHKALRDLLGEKITQTGSNITAERIRFDFSFERKLTNEEIIKIEQTVNDKIKENLPVSFKLMTIDEARKIGAVGLFQEKYGDKVKVYFIGDPSAGSGQVYSKESCGGPHVDFTGRLKRFKIIKQENLGKGQKRIYAKIGLPAGRQGENI